MAARYGIVMKFSAAKAPRKCPYALFWRGPTLVVTAAVALMLSAQPGPAEAGRPGAWPQQFWNDVFQDARPKRRRATAIVAPVPLPQPRPADAPAPLRKRTADKAGEKAKPDAAGRAEDAKPADVAKPDKPAEEATATPPPPSACRLALTDAIAIAPSIPDIHGPGACGGEDLVRLEAVVLPDKSHVAVKPAAILRCTMASALADWVRTDVISTHSNAEDATALPARGYPSTAAPTPSMFAP